jgi:signal transduction histidine kinase/AraC-like DNA-binding protein
LNATYRIGLDIPPADPYWVQVREAVHGRAQQLGAELIALSLLRDEREVDGQVVVTEEVLSLGLDALIVWDLPDAQIHQLLARGVPIVHLHHRTISHPKFVAPRDLYQVARQIGAYINAELGGRGRVLVVGGLCDAQGDGGRLAGLYDELRAAPQIELIHIPSVWRYEQAYQQIYDAMALLHGSYDALFGLSDSVALAGRDAGKQLGVIDEQTLIIGINGDPLALAAIAAGSMRATVDIHVAEFGAQIAELAYRAAQGEQLPPSFTSTTQLVTAANVAAVAAQKLLALAELPSRLVGVNRQQEQQRLVQLETSLAINRQVGGLLDRRQLAHTIAELIRTNYGFDRVQLLYWSQERGVLWHEPLANGDDAQVPIQSPVLAQALQQRRPIFIPDMQRSLRFPPEAAWPGTRTRLVLPMRFGDSLLGLLDLHSERLVYHSSAQLVGLEALGDQLAIALRNADLYQEALAAQTRAQRADQLKTHLLANVSHELRTPLNVILGYSQTALDSIAAHPHPPPPMLSQDIAQIYASGEHLLRLINDLLDLSRAEIDELDLFPELLDTKHFLMQVFRSIAESFAAHSAVAWQLDLPAALPPLWADPLRLRQILFNLLGNAHKFTERGQITLGAAVAAAQLHIWVADSGCGIALDQQERIFEPFVTGEPINRRPGGIGLGLSIVRRLTLLHGGKIALESQPGRGTTFHLYLPLPSQHEADRLALLRGPTEVVVKPLSQHALHGLLAEVRPTTNVGSILVVDDSDEARALYVRFIRSSLPGYQVYEADGGAAALELLGALTPSLVILDLAMPQVDGFAVLAALRDNPRTQHTPVIIVSGQTLSYDDVKRLDHVQVAYQTKDILTPEEATALLQRSLSGADWLPQQTSGLARRAVAYLQQCYQRSLSRQELADAVGVSKSYLSAIFHQELGLSPWDYLHRYRISRAKLLLRSSSDSITAIAAAVGFDDPGYFSRVFHRLVGRSPRHYRNAPSRPATGRSPELERHKA